MWHKHFSQPRVIRCGLLFLLLLSSACSTRQPVIASNVQHLPQTVASIAISTSPTVPDPPSATPFSTATLAPSPFAEATATTLPPTITPTHTSEASEPGEACQQPHGEVLSLQTQDTLYENGSARIYLPPCYSNHPARRYPTLYLLHGMNNTDEQWVRLGVPETADQLIHAGQVLPFIIVMPNETLSDQDPDDSQFDDWLVNTLVPKVDQEYATCITRECRAIGGLSRGSGWAFRIGLINWQTFGAIGAHSFSPFDGDLEKMDTWLTIMSAGQRPRLYLDIGIYDQAIPDAQQFEQKLINLRFEHEWHLNDGAHNEDYWHAHVAEYLKWYAAGWK